MSVCTLFCLPSCPLVHFLFAGMSFSRSLDLCSQFCCMVSQDLVHTSTRSFRLSSTSVMYRRLFISFLLLSVCLSKSHALLLPTGTLSLIDQASKFTLAFLPLHFTGFLFCLCFSCDRFTSIVHKIASRSHACEHVLTPLFNTRFYSINSLGLLSHHFALHALSSRQLSCGIYSLFTPFCSHPVRSSLMVVNTHSLHLSSCPLHLHLFHSGEVSLPV